MTDDRFDELLRAAAAEYNRPPSDAPRDAMWARIEAARAATDAAPRVLPLRPRRAVPWTRLGIGVAAVLTLGVGIGRWSARNEMTRGTVAVGAPARSPAGASERPPLDRLPYRLVAAEHLTQAEALLTSYRAESRSGAVDARQLSSWARDLLGTTRLLLDSPAADDPKLRRLFEDLELVLAEIAQLPAGRPRDELDLIDQSIEQRGIISKLRTTDPAGLSPAGT